MVQTAKCQICDHIYIWSSFIIYGHMQYSCKDENMSKVRSGGPMGLMVPLGVVGFVGCFRSPSITCQGVLDQVVFGSVWVCCLCPHFCFVLVLVWFGLVFNNILDGF